MRLIILLCSIVTSPVYADVLFELHVGAEWLYEMEGTENRQGVVRIETAHAVDGVLWYRLNEFGEVFWIRNGDGGQIEALNVDEDGPHMRGDADDELLVFHYPAEAGERWSFFDTEVTYQGVRSMSLPAGGFDCHAYHLDMGDGDYSLSCFTPEVGLVYNEAVLEGGPKTVARLLRFNVPTGQ